jgi:hypothetical protein
MKRAILAALLAALIAGCGDDDDPLRPIPTPPFRYPAPTSPDSALLIYKYAWERKDSTKIDSILATDYMGTSTDQSDPGGPTLTFFKYDEVRVVHHLQQDSNVGQISVNFGPPISWSRFSYESDPPGWRSIRIPQSQIVVELQSGEALVADDSAVMEFKMKPAAISGTDTTWAIVRWQEVRTGP